MKLVVGCPIYMRDWILPKWLDALALEAKGMHVELAFVVTSGDDQTEEIIRAESDSGRFHCVHTRVFSGGNEGTDRRWFDRTRIQTLADKRNVLIEMVRNTSPDFFFSLDSDVIVTPGSVRALVKRLDGGSLSAISPVVLAARNWVNAYRRCEGKSFYFLPDGGKGLVDVDVIHAAVLMKPQLFTDKRIRYGVAEHGKDYFWTHRKDSGIGGYSEDFFWCARVKDAGYRLALDYGIRMEHIPHQWMISQRS